MRAALPALGLAAILGLASTSCAMTGGARDAWFVRNGETGQWCAFVDEASASTAVDDERFDWREAAWLRYGDRPIILLVTLQSEDAYVDDTYSFAPDLSLTEVVRNGRYVEDPYFTATFRPDETGGLRLTAESTEALHDLFPRLAGVPVVRRASFRRSDRDRAAPFGFGELLSFSRAPASRSRRHAQMPPA